MQGYQTVALCEKVSEDSSDTLQAILRLSVVQVLENYASLEALLQDQFKI